MSHTIRDQQAGRRDQQPARRRPARQMPESRLLLLLLGLAVLATPSLAQQGTAFTYISYRASGSGPSAVSQVPAARWLYVMPHRPQAHETRGGPADGGGPAADRQRDVQQGALGRRAGAAEQLQPVQPRAGGACVSRDGHACPASSRQRGCVSSTLSCLHW